MTFHLYLSTEPLPKVGIPAHSYAMLTAVAEVGGHLSDAVQPPTCWECAMEKYTPGNQSVAGRHLGEIPLLPDQIQHCGDWRAGEGIKREDPVLSHQLRLRGSLQEWRTGQSECDRTLKASDNADFGHLTHCTWRPFPF